MEEIKKDEMYRIKMVNEVLTEKGYDGKELGEYEIEMIGSTGSVDRDGEAIDPNGWDLKSFKKNPVILPQHNYQKPPIGRAKQVKLIDGKLMFKIEFPEEGINPEADVYRKLYKSGFMNASSVGFAPKEWVDGDGKKTPYRTFTKQELLELSLVSVPANSEALVTAKSKGVVSSDELKSIGFEDEEVVEEKTVVIEEKSDDPNLLINDTHMKLHEEMSAFIEMATLKLAFLDGFIAGQAKSTDLEEVKEVSNISYIKELLSGEPKPKSNEQASTGLTDALREKSLKNILKGE